MTWLILVAIASILFTLVAAYRIFKTASDADDQMFLLQDSLTRRTPVASITSTPESEAQRKVS